MNRRAAWIAELTVATEAAAEAEATYRAEYARRVEALAQERAFAFRRANLLRAIAEVVAAAGDEPTAVAHGLAILRARLGWGTDSPAQDETIARFAPVCAALHACGGETQVEDGEPPPDPAAALAEFETWHIAARGTPFWVLFETWMPETPVVDF